MSQYFLTFPNYNYRDCFKSMEIICHKVTKIPSIFFVPLRKLNGHPQIINIDIFYRVILVFFILII